MPERKKRKQRLQVWFEMLYYLLLPSPPYRYGYGNLWAAKARFWGLATLLPRPLYFYAFGRLCLGGSGTLLAAFARPLKESKVPYWKGGEPQLMTGYLITERQGQL